MNMLYVHKNWNDEVALQKALVGPFVACDDVPSPQDPELLTRDDSMLRIRDLECTIESLQNRKAESNSKVSCNDESFVNVDDSDSSICTSSRYSKSVSSSILQRQEYTRNRILGNNSSSEDVEFCSSFDEGDKVVTKHKNNVQRNNSTLKSKQLVLEDTSTSESNVRIKKARGRPCKASNAKVSKAVNAKGGAKGKASSLKRKVSASTHHLTCAKKKRTITDF